MDYQKIINLLENTPNIEINDDARETHTVIVLI